VVAFSGVGMAKNVEVKESIKKTSKKKAFAAEDCNAAKFVAYVDVKLLDLVTKKPLPCVILFILCIWD
jgi:hypothetical protein